MSPFDPVGERARWKVLYDLLLEKDLDDLLSYREMGQALDLHPVKDRHTIQMSFRRASKEYEQENNRAIEAVPNKGYRIVEPNEHLRLAKEHQKKSGKALARGHSKVIHVDQNGMDPEIRKAFEVTARAFSVLMDFNRRLDTRQTKLEEAIDSMTTRHSRTEGELQELRARLERLESS